MALNEKTVKLIKQCTESKPNCNVTIGISENGSEQYYTYLLSNEISPLLNTLYEIGSITKVFTTSLLCKSLAAGSISLSDTIDTYITDLPRGLCYPTILQLATHFSGYGTMEEDLVDDGRKQNPFLAYDYAYMLDKINQFAQNPINTNWEYSNLGFGVLGHILGIVNGGTYHQVMKDFIEYDLKIKDMQFGLDFDNSIHGFDGKVDCGNWLWTENCPFAPAGYLSASVIDLLKFTDIHLYSRLPYLAASQQIQGKITEQDFMGLGWMLDMADNTTYCMGGTGRFTSFTGFHIQSKVAVVVLMNDYVNGTEATYIAESIFEDYI